MALLSIFKKAKDEIVSIPYAERIQLELDDFRFYYLYGFSNDPNRTSHNIEAFHNLYQLVIGNIGGLMITNSFHPYFTINAKGVTTWTDAYIKMAIKNNKDEIFRMIRNERAVYTTSASPAFNELNIWPDTRLTYEENPALSKYIPFIIPFLVLKTEQSPYFETAINSSRITNGYATEYLEEVTNAIRFFMPAPAFVMGFGEFEGAYSPALIDNFIACKPILGVE